MATRRSNGEGGLSWNKARQRWVSSSLRKVSHSETWGQMRTSAAITSAEVLTTDGFALPAEFNIVFERAGEVTVRLDFQSGLVKRVALEATGDHPEVVASDVRGLPLLEFRDEAVKRLMKPVSTAKRRDNHEGTVPRLRPDGRWQIDLRYLSNGVGKRTTVYGKTQGQARAKAKALRKRLELGQPARDTTDTVGTFALEWITTALAASERKASTKAMYATLTRNHIASSALGGMPLGKATPRAVEGWLVELRARGLAESTVRIAYDILLAILETALRDGALGRNPVAAVKRPRVTRHEASYLTPDQVRAVLSAAEGTRYAPLSPCSSTPASGAVRHWLCNGQT
jgi:hypothetical protein